MACRGCCSPPAHHLHGQLLWLQCSTSAVVVGNRYVKLDSLCFGGGHMNVYTDWSLVLGTGWEMMFLGKTSKTDHSKSNLAEEGNGGSS